MSDNLVYIDSCTFIGCSSLESITLPQNLQEIRQSAFASCGLKSIEIPNQVSRIGGFAFQNNKSLKTVITSSGLKEIYYFAFSLCDSLRTLVLGENVEAIGCDAFELCRKLSAIYSLNPNPPSLDQKFDAGRPTFNLDNWLTQTFVWNDEQLPLYVPLGSKTAYSNSNWNIFKNIVEFDPNTLKISDVTSIHSILSKDNTGYIYSLNGQIQSTPSKGINIIKMKDGPTKKVLIK